MCTYLVFRIRWCFGLNVSLGLNVRLGAHLRIRPFNIFLLSLPTKERFNNYLSSKVISQIERSLTFASTELADARKKCVIFPFLSFLGLGEKNTTIIRHIELVRGWGKLKNVRTSTVNFFFPPRPASLLGDCGDKGWRLVWLPIKLTDGNRCTTWVASFWGFSEKTIQPAWHECNACCLLRARFLAFQPVADNTRGTRVEQVVSSFQKILRGSQLTWYSDSN